MEDINDDNVLLYAIKAYDKHNYIKSEFAEDFRSFRYIKRLLHRYRTVGELRERLIINHLTTVYNVFGVEATTRILFYKVSPEDYGSLKTFLIFLNMMPELVRSIQGKDIRSSDINVDLKLAAILRTI